MAFKVKICGWNRPACTTCSYMYTFDMHTLTKREKKKRKLVQNSICFENTECMKKIGAGQRALRMIKSFTCKKSAIESSGRMKDEHRRG